MITTITSKSKKSTLKYESAILPWSSAGVRFVSSGRHIATTTTTTTKHSHNTNISNNIIISTSLSNNMRNTLSPIASFFVSDLWARVSWRVLVGATQRDPTPRSQI